jgi:CRISPR-associated endonuclease Csn1
MRKSIHFRLGLDLGTNSLGWCITDLGKPDREGRMHPVRIRRMGVRIFPDGRDPQSGASLAQARREPRSARRRRDRFLDRRADLMGLLIKHGLMPPDPAERKTLETTDPWRIRAEGLDRELTLHELGRALFHLNQRRGFKSNRRTDRKDKASEAQGMKAGAAELAARLDPKTPGHRTLGEYLYVRRRKDRTPRGARDGPVGTTEPVRFRPSLGKGGRAEWEIYPTRAMVEAEFDALWLAQAKHHPGLTDEARDAIRHTIFWQRPLRLVEPGPCTLDPEPDRKKRDLRAPLALPIQQEFRMLQELANLELRHKRTGETRRLTRAERDKVLLELRRRPIIDLVAARLAAAGRTAVDRDAKKILAEITALDMRTERGRTPLFLCLERLATSLALSYERAKPALDLPLAPLPLEIPAVGTLHDPSHAAAP